GGQGFVGAYQHDAADPGAALESIDDVGHHRPTAHFDERLEGAIALLFERLVVGSPCQDDDIDFHLVLPSFDRSRSPNSSRRAASLRRRFMRLFSALSMCSWATRRASSGSRWAKASTTLR